MLNKTSHLTYLISMAAVLSLTYGISPVQADPPGSLPPGIQDNVGLQTHGQGDTQGEHRGWDERQKWMMQNHPEKAEWLKNHAEKPQYLKDRGEKAEWFRNHPEERQKWLQNHPEKAEMMKERAQAWASNHPEKAEWLKNHPPGQGGGFGAQGHFPQGNAYGNGGISGNGHGGGRNHK